MEKKKKIIIEKKNHTERKSVWRQLHALNDPNVKKSRCW